MRCSKCRRELREDWAVALDYSTGLPTCGDCCRKQRHLHRTSWLREAFDRFKGQPILRASEFKREE